MMLWTHHRSLPEQPWLIAGHVAEVVWPLWALCAVAIVVDLARSLRRLDGALLLLAGGALVAPLTGKVGATWSYYVPLMIGAALYAARVLLDDPRLALRALPLVTAVLLLATQRFPLPSALDERTAAFFYEEVSRRDAEASSPVLAMRPDLVYVKNDQPVEIEGSSFTELLQQDAPGTFEVVRDVYEERYRLIVAHHEMTPAASPLARALLHRYRYEGLCVLGYYHQPVAFHLFRRRASAAVFTPPADVRCRRGGLVPKSFVAAAQAAEDY